MLEAISKGEVILTKRIVRIGERYTGKARLLIDDKKGVFEQVMPHVDKNLQDALIHKGTESWGNTNKYSWDLKAEKA